MYVVKERQGGANESEARVGGRGPEVGNAAVKERKELRISIDAAHVA